MKELSKIVESAFIEELHNYFDKYDIIRYWVVKFDDYNPAFNGCALRVRYLGTAYNDRCVDIDIWKKRISGKNYTFKFIIKDMIQNEISKMENIVKELGV